MNRYEEIPILPEPGRWGAPRAGWAAAAVAIGVTLLLLAAYSTLASRFHDPGIPYLSHRLELARSFEPADVVFLGTSVIHRDIDTGYLNERAADRGCDLSFLNLGAPAMSVAEFSMLLDELGEREEPPRFVAFNPTLYDGLSRLDSRRAAWANRLGALGLSYQSLEARRTTARQTNLPDHEGEGWRARLGFARYWALAILRSGEAAHWLLRDRTSTNERLNRQLHLENAGFLGLEDDPDVKQERELAFRRRADSWRKRAEHILQVAEEFHRGLRKDRLPDADRQLQENLLAAVRRIGAEPIAVFPPQIAYQSQLIEFYRELLGEERVLDFTFYPHREFLDEELWFDWAHLNRAGSRLLSEQILERFCPPEHPEAG